MFKYFIILSLSQFLAACEPGQEMASDEMNSKIDAFEIVYLKEVSNYIQDFSHNCPLESNKADCVTICHVPPGNPSNRKNLIIPAAAVRAHIKHGGPHHNHHDFIGSCSQILIDDCAAEYEDDCNSSNNNNQDQSLEDNESNNGSPDDELDNNEQAPSEDEPIYCEPTFENDLDCDGFDDKTDAPIY